MEFEMDRVVKVTSRPCGCEELVMESGRVENRLCAPCAISAAGHLLVQASEAMRRDRGERRDA